MRGEPDAVQTRNKFRAASGVVEQLARFRGQRLTPALLRRRGRPLAIAELTLTDDARLVDLDDPVVLKRENLRPSKLATRDREITQAHALTPHTRHPESAGLRWWSTYESLWTHVTLFDRAGASCACVKSEPSQSKIRPWPEPPNASGCSCGRHAFDPVSMRRRVRNPSFTDHTSALSIARARRL